MNAIIQTVMKFVVAGPHTLVFLVAFVVFFFSLGIGAKWGPMWAWVVAALTLLFVIARLYLVKW